MSDNIKTNFEFFSVTYIKSSKIMFYIFSMSENSIVCKEYMMLATNKQTLVSNGWICDDMFMLGDEIFHQYVNKNFPHSLLLKTHGGLMITACGAPRLLEDYNLVIADTDILPEYWDGISVAYTQ